MGWWEGGLLCVADILLYTHLITERAVAPPWCYVLLPPLRVVRVCCCRKQASMDGPVVMW